LFIVSVKRDILEGYLNFDFFQI